VESIICKPCDTVLRSYDDLESHLATPEHILAASSEVTKPLVINSQGNYSVRVSKIDKFHEDCQNDSFMERPYACKVCFIHIPESLAKRYGIARKLLCRTILCGSFSKDFVYHACGHEFE